MMPGRGCAEHLQPFPVPIAGSFRQSFGADVPTECAQCASLLTLMACFSTRCSMSRAMAFRLAWVSGVPGLSRRIFSRAGHLLPGFGMFWTRLRIYV